MFDGIDQVVIFTHDAAQAIHLYVDHLGFQLGGWVEHSTDSVYSALWGLPAGRVRHQVLTKPGAAGGHLRIVEAPALSQQPAASLARPGPLSIDFYVRDLQGMFADLTRDGFSFTSPPVRYELFGTGFAVDEVLLRGPGGFLHALVDYLPNQHRCVLGHRMDQRSSEVVAAITATGDIEVALSTTRDVLGGRPYFDQIFRGPEIDAMLELQPGSAFRAVLLRGPTRRNARIELMTTVPDSGEDAFDSTRSHPGMALAWTVNDLSTTVDAVRRADPAATVRGPVCGTGDLGHSRGVAVVATGWGAVLELSQEDGQF